MKSAQKILKFLEENNIPFKIQKNVDNCLMSTICKIHKGIFIVDKNFIDKESKNYTSLILHELGHFLSVPEKARVNLTSTLKGVDVQYISEYAARIVAYRVAEELKIPLKEALSIFVNSNSYDRNYTIKSYYSHALIKYFEEKRWGYLAILRNTRN